MKRIYFDHSATTPVEPEVVEVMTTYLVKKFGNPSSVHYFGREAKVALEEARETIAGLIHAEPEEIFFTSGGTEADNLALQGVAFRYKKKGNHIISSPIEHRAVLNTCGFLESQGGVKVTYVPVDPTGRVEPERVKEAITEGTTLISIMHVNNEVGTINPIAEIGRIAREQGILFHTDAVQSFGKFPIDVKEMGVDLLALSGHKIYGPKGVGALYVRKGVDLAKLIYGGHHERDLRAGTENLPGAVGMAKAAEICGRVMASEAKRLTGLQNYFWEKIKERVPRVHLNGHPTERLPGSLNLSFEGVEGESLLLSLDLEGIAASTGSACSAGSPEPSHVLTALGLSPELAQVSIRITMGRSNTREDVDYALKVIQKVVTRLREMAM